MSIRNHLYKLEWIATITLLSICHQIPFHKSTSVYRFETQVALLTRRGNMLVDGATLGSNRSILVHLWNAYWYLSAMAAASAMSYQVSAVRLHAAFWMWGNRGDHMSIGISSNGGFASTKGLKMTSSSARAQCLIFPSKMEHAATARIDVDHQIAYAFNHFQRIAPHVYQKPFIQIRMDCDHHLIEHLSSNSVP